MITTVISAHNEEKNIRNILKEVIRELENLSRVERFSLRTNSGHINKANINLEKLLNFSERIPPGNLREVIYTIGLIIDKDSRQVYGEIADFFVQERGFPSVIAYSKVFHKFWFSKYFGELFVPFYQHFDYNLLISCSNSEREKRFKHREIMTSLDKKIKT
jgi:hypothetical protein